MNGPLNMNSDIKREQSKAYLYCDGKVYAILWLIQSYEF